MERVISGVGLLVMLGVAWLMSSNRRAISRRVVLGGLVLQFGFALLILRTEQGRQFFKWLGDGFSSLQKYSDAGASFVFGPELMAKSFAFSVLPTVIFFSALMSVLYYIGVMQLVVRGLSKLMQMTLGTSGAETLSAAANIFVGQTEAPLLIKPYVARMTDSEIMAVMVGGFATIAGGVMAAYVRMGIPAEHLMTASVISAPASLLIAKIMVPETETPDTAGVTITEHTRVGENVIEAATIGTVDGLKLALNVGAMLIAFTALIALIDALLQATLGLVGVTCTLGQLLGYAFAPFAWVMGIPTEDCVRAGELLGIRTVANEFVAYNQLGEWLKPESSVHLGPRTIMLLSYALCGFANFASIGIQIGGVGSLVPEKQPVLAKLGLRAMIGGMLACFMTACIAGMLVD
jgi:CNT family concentrative nucleoside transporter